eukprot:1768786-Karenia_brevis.AAC.1
MAALPNPWQTAVEASRVNEPPEPAQKKVEASESMREFNDKSEVVDPLQAVRDKGFEIGLRIRRADK